MYMVAITLWNDTFSSPQLGTFYDNVIYSTINTMKKEAIMFSSITKCLTLWIGEEYLLDESIKEQVIELVTSSSLVGINNKIQWNQL